ncbi:RNAPII degradation factor [Mortierella claussenii]|nr:RNAPII degradation factor [Mortierella claussenii]
MATFHSNNSQRRKDEPEELRQLRQEHGGSLATLKELFADWTEEDLLYAIQDAGGDVELAILRISEGHVTQWGEVKGKKKTPKPKTASEKQEFRTSNSQRGGFAGRGRGDSFRGGRGGATRGAPRALNGGDRSGRPFKTEVTAEQVSNDIADSKTDSNDTSAAADSSETAPAWGAAPSTTNDSSDSTNAWSSSATVPATTNTSNDSWGTTPAATTISTDSRGASPAAAESTDSWSATPAAAESTDSWGASPAAVSVVPVRKLNTATIPPGSKMSWAKIVKPEPASVPKPVAAPASVATPKPVPTPAPVAAPAPVDIPAPEPVAPKIEEPVIEKTPEVSPAAEEKAVEEKAVEEKVVEEKAVEETTPEASEPAVKEKVEKVEEKTEEPAVAAEAAQTSDVAAKSPVGPPGLKHKTASQPRRLNQDAPVVMPSGSSALQSVGVKFGSFSLNDETEIAEPETQPAQPAQPEQPAQQPAAATAQSTTQSQQQQQQPAAYGRQPSAPPGASGYQGVSSGASGLSPAATNASYLKQDPAVNYLGQHHHHPGMGHDAMGSPYGSYMPNPANQLGSFGMGPMATLPNDYAALYGNDLQRAMYYDPASYGQIPVTAGNNYHSRDSKYNQDSSSTASTSGASSTSSTQAQQTLQQQQQQQQAYPNMAGGMPYYPYYYMAPNQFPNYQQSGYGQPFVNKNMYPMYQHQQQQHSTKPGTATSSPYGNYGSTAGQGHYSQAGYEDMSGAGIHGMGGLNNDPYTKYGNAGMQNFLGNQQQQSTTPTSNANSNKGNAGANSYNSGSDKNAAAGSQSSNASQMAGGASSLQGQQPGVGNGNQGQQGYYQQHMFSNYQYPSHHQGYHPNQHQGQHQGSGRNQQQFWGSQN